MNTAAIAKAIPCKKLMVTQCVISAVLILVVCVLSFMPLFKLTITLDENTKATAVDVMNILNENGENEEVALPEELTIDLAFMVRSVRAGFDLAKGLLDLANHADAAVNDTDKALNEGNVVEGAENAGDSAEEAVDLVDTVLTQDAVNLAALLAFYVNAFQTNFMLALCYVFLFGMIFVVPINALVAGIVAIVALFVAIKDPRKANHRMNHAMNSVLSLSSFFFLLMLLIPGVRFCAAIYVIGVVIGLGALVNLVASRLKYYEKPDFKYLNVLQIVSALALVFYGLFLLGMERSGVVAKIFARLSEFAIQSVMAIVDGEGSIGASQIVSIILVALFTLALIASVSRFKQLLSRLACMSKSETDHHIVTASVSLVVAILPVVLMLTSFDLTLSGGEIAFFVMAVLGLVLLLTAEIVMAIMGKKVYEGEDSRGRIDVLCGDYYIAEDHLPGADKNAEETETEEAVSEETTEEAVAPEEATEQTEEATDEAERENTEAVSAEETEEATEEVMTEAEESAEDETEKKENV